MAIDAVVLDPDGRERVAVSLCGPRDDPDGLGRRAARSCATAAPSRCWRGSGRAEPIQAESSGFAWRIVIRAIEPERDRRYQEAHLMHLDITNLSRTPESTIRIEKHVPAPPAQVFAVWTDPGQMADWYAPSDDFGPTVAKVDLHVGGPYRVGMLLPGRTDPRFVSGQYCRVDAPRTLSFTWAWEPLDAATHETQVTLEFRPREKGPTSS